MEKNNLNEINIDQMTLILFSTIDHNDRLEENDEFVEIYSDEETERQRNDTSRCLLINKRMNKCVRCPEQIKQIERKRRI